MTPITPTLGDLRKRLRIEGMPHPREEFAFDLDTEARPRCSCGAPLVEDPSGIEAKECIACGEPAYLPDWLLVNHQTCQLVLDGTYDHCSDATPIEELRTPTTKED